MSRSLAQLDELLWSTDPIVSRFAWNSAFNMGFGQLIDKLYRDSGEVPTRVEERSLFVGHALKHGSTAIGELGLAAAFLDSDHFHTTSAGVSKYPMGLHLYYVKYREHSPEALTKFYETEADDVYERYVKSESRFVESDFQ